MASPLSLLLSRPYGMVGAALISVFVLVGVLGPAISPYDPNEPHPLDRLMAPGAQSRSGNSYLMGTDYLGRDVLSRALAAPRVYLWIGVIAVIAGATAGLVSRVVFGHGRGKSPNWVEGVFRFLANIPWVIFPLVPGGVVVLFIIAFVGPGYWNVVIVAGIVASLKLAPAFYFGLAPTRIGEEQGRASSGRLSGERTVRVGTFFQHVGAGFGLAVGMAIILEGVLSFLGLGVQPPQPSLGRMLSLEGRISLEAYPFYGGVIGAIIVVGIAGYVLLALSLREAYDIVRAGRAARRPWFYRTWFLSISFSLLPVIWCILILRSPWHRGRGWKITAWLLVLFWSAAYLGSLIETPLAAAIILTLNALILAAILRQWSKVHAATSVVDTPGPEAWD